MSGIPSSTKSTGELTWFIIIIFIIIFIIFIIIINISLKIVLQCGSACCPGDCGLELSLAIAGRPAGEIVVLPLERQPRVTTFLLFCGREWAVVLVR
jgi:hypothetical protein